VNDAAAARAPRKAEVTKAHILDTALRLFAERGYDGATMRVIADEAGVSLGNAYYYFKSKEHLVQAYYARMSADYVARTADMLTQTKDFGERLTRSMEMLLDVIAPYHAFAGVLFRTAADPSSPLSPFSEESEPTRRLSIEMYAELVEGSDAKMIGELREELPHLLWLYHMGVVLFWVHDSSPNVERTRVLIERTVPVIASLVGMSRIPGLRPIARDLTRTITELRTFVQAGNDVLDTPESE